MRDYSALVDCMNASLSNGGIIEGECLAEFFQDGLPEATDLLFKGTPPARGLAVVPSSVFPASGGLVYTV